MQPDYNVILEKINNIASTMSDMKLSIKDIEGHVSVINDGSHLAAIEVAKLTTRLDTIEKFLWLVVAASVTAVVGSFYALILHKRKQDK